MVSMLNEVSGFVLVSVRVRHRGVPLVAIRLSPPDIAMFRLSMATMLISTLGSVCAVWKPPD